MEIHKENYNGTNLSPLLSRIPNNLDMPTLHRNILSVVNEGSPSVQLLLQALYTQRIRFHISTHKTVVTIYMSDPLLYIEKSIVTASVV
jgi:hypothetical protein